MPARWQLASSGCLVGRVRPKLMTAGCAMLGLLPLVLSGAQGGELEGALAIVMIGGLVTSTLFTLLALPTFYSLVEHVTASWRKSPREIGHA
jgi:heavy metal efflux system protein